MAVDHRKALADALGAPADHTWDQLLDQVRATADAPTRARASDGRALAEQALLDDYRHRDALPGDTRRTAAVDRARAAYRIGWLNGTLNNGRRQHGYGLGWADSLPPFGSAAPREDP